MCKELPAYQISLLSNTSSRFTCKKCVKINKEVRKVMEKMKDKNNLTKQETMRLLCYVKDENEKLKLQNREYKEEKSRKDEAIKKIRKEEREKREAAEEKMRASINEIKNEAKTLKDQNRNYERSEEILIDKMKEMER